MRRLAIYLYILYTAALFAQPSNETSLLSMTDTSEEPSITFGGHFNVYAHSSSEYPDEIGVSQFGLMAYGQITSRIRYLAEVGAEDPVKYHDADGEAEDNNIILNRLFAEYTVNEAFNIKAGQFLTPIGLYNPTYIGALRWTSVTPFVAQGFFPKIIAGVDVNGRFGENLNYEYDLFYHIDGEHDQNPNAVRASEFAGAEVRYVFPSEGKIGIPLGRFRSDSSMEICRFAGVNFIQPFGASHLSGELLRKTGSWDLGGSIGEQHWDELAWYLQYVHAFKPSHFATLRYGYNNRTETGWYTDRRIVAGYVYRPRHGLSLKAEYSYYAKEIYTEELKDHSLYLSAGVLF